MISPLFDLTYVVLDFETTGLSPRKGSEVVETGAVRMEGGKVTASFEELSRPVRPIPPGALAVHGISNEMVADQPYFSAVLPRLLDFLGDSILVAHNAPFDRSFLDAAVALAGRPALGNDVLDTVRLSRRLFPDLDRHDLTSLCTVHRIDRDRGHRALDDARATAELLRILLERAAEEDVTGRPEILRLGESTSRRRGASSAGAAADTVRIDAAQQARLEEALATGDRIGIRYVSVKGIRSRRTIVPYQLDRAGEFARLVAHDLEVDATRTFRLDRIVAVEDAAAPEEGEGEE